MFNPPFGALSLLIERTRLKNLVLENMSSEKPSFSDERDRWILPLLKAYEQKNTGTSL
jgi:hypothetical protein